jgi:hypothetical protein
MAEYDDEPAPNSLASPETTGSQSGSDTVPPTRKYSAPGSANSKYKGSEAKNMRRRITYALKKQQLPREAHLRTYNSLTQGQIDSDLLDSLNEVRKAHHLARLTPAAFRAEFNVSPFVYRRYDPLMDPLNEQPGLIDQLQQKCKDINKATKLINQNRFPPAKVTPFAKAQDPAFAK